MHIKLVTYMRASEYVNDGFRNALDLLKTLDSEVECIIFTDCVRSFDGQMDVLVKNIVYPGTKYVRLLKLINEEDKACLYISIDNDMVLEPKNFINYVKSCVEKNVDFSWARLMAQDNNHVISKFVSVDKLLSHNIIRPLLWKMGVGLSIPGQCFLIRPLAFQNQLYEMDTFLDDLALGAFVSEHFKALNVYISDEVIGYEFPNETVKGLYRQRKRWAKGFYQILRASTGKNYFYKLCIHGIAYHMNWLFHWILILLFARLNLYIAVAYILCCAILITNRRKSYFLWGILYQFVFPIFHFVWIINLIKGEKNSDNG